MTGHKPLYQNVKIVVLVVMAIYFAVTVSFYFIGGDQFKYRNVELENLSADKPVGEIIAGYPVTQYFTVPMDRITDISVQFATYLKQVSDTIDCRITNTGTGEVLDVSLDTADLIDNAFTSVTGGQTLFHVRGQTLRLDIKSRYGAPGNAVTVWSSVTKPYYGGEFLINGTEVSGGLCMKVSGSTNNFAGQYYFFIVGVIGLALFGYLFKVLCDAKRDKSSFGLRLITAFIKYNFLLQQLVARDFKTKYKRSVLGVLWSFLNPLFLMTAQYIVFSTVFKSNISNFPVYLLSGIVIFSFFSEATTMGLGSVVGNSQLITKVYVPKYIFPVSRVLSSAINMLLSMIPLLLAVVFTGLRITPAVALLPFVLGCTVLFCLGVSLILSAVMVFFRDMQFLWSVVITLWMYMTPIFYPDSIIPAPFLTFYKMNPLYHFVRFFRIVLLQGVSPEPKAYLICLVFTLGTLILGGFVFKKTQDRFILNI